LYLVAHVNFLLNEYDDDDDDDVFEIKATAVGISLELQTFHTPYLTSLFSVTASEFIHYVRCEKTREMGQQVVKS